VNIDSALSVADLREQARRRLPRAIFDFIDGGAEDEVTTRANEAAWEQLTFVPQALVDVSSRTTAVQIRDVSMGMPLILGPAGLSRIFHPEGEIAIVRAAEQAQIPYVLNPFSSVTIEEARAHSSGDLWFETRPMPDAELAGSLLKRARAAEYSAMVYMADIPANGKLERQLRSGFSLPPKWTVENVLDGIRHPRWSAGFLRSIRELRPKNLEDEPMRSLLPKMPPPSLFYSRIATAGGTWTDLKRTRDEWPGLFVVKGIMSASDAVKAVEAGVDVIIVSNHGGRQLDGLPSSLFVLQEIVSAVGPAVDVLIDGGVRRGTHIAKALALGARACLVSRPYHYGLAAAGSEGVRRAIDIFKEEFDRCLAMLGCRAPSELTPSHVRSLVALPWLHDIES
jgi:isopentenyl diphosphate isomerase/L-lactate dehydrogenase-like FMN-dependent dehydrogenase